LSVALILAKGDSKRLPNKNQLDFHGEPMFMMNVRKCLKLFDKVYVSSEDRGILKLAQSIGAIPIMRDAKLCGDTPNIPVYQHAMHIMNDDFVAVQANSPTVSMKLIATVRDLIGHYDEVMTCHPDYKIYGSLWALSKNKLSSYQDCYNPKPQIMIVDTSTDVHDQKDFEEAIQQYGK
jgi:CMP-N-acetylneuraminic acid synthetase